MYHFGHIISPVGGNNGSTFDVFKCISTIGIADEQGSTQHLYAACDDTGV